MRYSEFRIVGRRCNLPAKYVAIRDKLIAEGKSSKEAKTRAAKIFNATRKKGEKPVTRKEGD